MRDNITSVTNFRECSLWCCNKAVYRRPRRISNHKLPFYNFWNFFYSFPRLSFDDHDANVPCTHALSFQYRAFPSRLFPLVARSPARVGFKSRPDIFVLSISTPLRRSSKLTLTFILRLSVPETRSLENWWQKGDARE